MDTCKKQALLNCRYNNVSTRYGRGASDNKGPLAAFLFAIKEIIAEDGAPPLDIVLILDGEGERDSFRGGFATAVASSVGTYCPFERHWSDILIRVAGKAKRHIAGEYCLVRFGPAMP